MANLHTSLNTIDSTHMPLLSANLAAQLLDGSLPWDHATQMHIDAFLKHYTLHDSYWIGLHAQCAWGDEAVAVLSFDPVWNPSVTLPTPVVSNWPWLFLRFNCVNTVRLSGFRDVKGVQRGISSVEVEHLSDEEAATEFTDHYGGVVSLRHFPLVDALAMSPNEEVLELRVSAV